MVQLSGRPLRLYGFRYGWEPIPRSVSVLGAADDEFLLEPVTGAAVVYEDGWVLLDTGFNTATIRDPEARAQHYVHPSYIGVVPPGEPLLQEVERAGLQWRDLAMIAISHLHCDHSGGLRHAVDGPPVCIQEREFAFAMDEATVEDAYFRTDYDIPGLTWDTFDGERELAPGLHALPTFGHTPGHMSFSVDLSETGTIVFACDAADLRENIEEPIPCGTTTHPHLAEAAADSIARLHHLDGQPDVQVWPGHDPVFWDGVRRPPRAYV